MDRDEKSGGEHISSAGADEAWICLLSDAVPDGSSRYLIYDFLSLSPGTVIDQELKNRPTIGGPWPIRLTVARGEILVEKDKVRISKCGIASNDYRVEEVAFQM